MGKMKTKTETVKTSADAGKANSVQKLEARESSLHSGVKGKRVLDRKLVEKPDELTRPTEGVSFVEFMESLNLHELDLEREPDPGRDVQL